MTFRIGTRGSTLAMAQANEIVRILRASGLSEEVEIVKVRTEGDSGARRANPAEGSFVHEINRLVMEGTVDAGIHSMKDLPVKLPEELTIAVIPRRGSRVDCLISPCYYTRMPTNSTIGTSSARRVSQLLRARRDVRPVSIRGNITTRIGKAEDGELEAVMLALCGVQRIGYAGKPPLGIYPLPAESFVPAGGQGALALVTGTGRLPESVIRRADDANTRREVELERSVLAHLGAGCNSPLGVSALALGRKCHLRIQLLSSDGMAERKVSRIVGDGEALDEILRPFRDSMRDGPVAEGFE